VLAEVGMFRSRKSPLLVMRK